MKKCLKCNEDKLVSDFSYRNKLKGTLHSYCKSCIREYDKKSSCKQNRKDSVRKAVMKSHKILRDYIENYKKANSCVKCGESRHYVLEFHHIKEKNFTIANAFRRCISIIKLKEEINKCMVLCANCHREEHYMQRLNIIMANNSPA